jgi:hypothetical protein
MAQSGVNLARGSNNQATAVQFRRNDKRVCDNPTRKRYTDETRVRRAADMLRAL